MLTQIEAYCTGGDANNTISEQLEAEGEQSKFSIINGNLGLPRM